MPRFNTYTVLPSKAMEVGWLKPIPEAAPRPTEWL